MFRKCEVLVVGAGSTGSSIAYHLTRLGMKDVIMVDTGDQVASGQTARSTALVRTHYSHVVVAKMALLSLRFFQRFEQELSGRSAGFRMTGLIIGGDSKSEKGIIENMSMHRDIGIVSRLLSQEEVKEIEPQIDPRGFSSIVYEPNSGYADPSMTATAFAQAARELGARFVPNTKVLDISKRNDLYVVNSTNGEIEAKKVVIATGPWSKEIFRKLGINLPIRPVRHPVTIYRRPDEYNGTRPLIFDFPRRMYYKPEGNNFFYAGSVELELDTSSGEVDPDNYHEDVSYDEIENFSRAVTECVPIMGEKGSFQRAYTGVYDVTPDQEPIIDELYDWGYEGLFCLIGLSGHGFKLCPEFGRIMSELVLQGSFREYDVSIFKGERFEKGNLIKSKYKLGTVA